MSEGENRDRELENLLGQFLVASFQSSRLAEIIHDKISFRSRPREMRILVSDNLSSSKKPPLLVTIRIEPYVPTSSRNMGVESEGLYKVMTVLESPPLDMQSPSRVQAEMEEILEGSLKWWGSQEQYSHLKFNAWHTKVSIVNATDTSDSNDVYRVLEALEAKRKGEIASP